MGAESAAVTLGASALAGAAQGTAGALFGGGGGGDGRLKFTPEHEVQFVREFGERLAQINDDIERTFRQEELLNQRLDTIDQLARGAIPDQEAIQRLNESSQALAATFAGGAQEMAEKGFLTDEDQQELAELKALESEDFKDPALERELRMERDAHEQNLIRRGITGTQLEREMRRFDEDARIARFQRAEQLRSGKLQRGLARIGVSEQLRAAGFGRATNVFDILQRQVSADRLTTQAAAGFLGQTALSRLQAGQSGIEARSGLRGEAREGFQQLGQTKLTGEAIRSLIESGRVGPGSIFEQTGVARRDTKRFKDIVAEREKAQSRATNFPEPPREPDDFAERFPSVFSGQGFALNRARLNKELEKLSPAARAIALNRFDRQG